MPRQMPQILRGVIAGVWLLAQAMPAQPAESKKQEEAQFLELLHALPGDYDNLTQTEAENGAQHTAVVLSIKPLEVQSLGRLVLLARESAANDKRRVLAQRIWTLERDKQHRIVQHVFIFKEPQRWAQSVEEPELLQALLPDDLTQLSGCELIWTKTATGFSAATRPNACRPSAEHEGLLLETSAQINGDDLTMMEQQAGAGGRLPAEVDPASAYHFQRRGG
jgi:hypothetical protein